MSLVELTNGFQSDPRVMVLDVDDDFVDLLNRAASDSNRYVFPPKINRPTLNPRPRPTDVPRPYRSSYVDDLESYDAMDRDEWY